MVQTWKVLFPAENGPDERTAYIYLPETYRHEPEQRYPVLYMFDGHNVFFDEDATYGKSWGLAEYLDYTDSQLIVAAVECSHDPDNGRLKEYSPFTFTDPHLGHIRGTGRATMEWFVNVFKPEIDENFRTLPDRAHTYIAGSSMGGLMSLYAVLKYNAVFSRAAALSPSLWTNPERVLRMAEKSRVRRDTVIYMDYGSREMNGREQMREHFGKFADILFQRKIFVTTRVVPYGTHCEACWEKQLPFVIHTLTYEP